QQVNGVVSWLPKNKPPLTEADLMKREDSGAHINQEQVSHRDWWNQGHWQGHRRGLRPTRRPGLCAWTERTGWSRNGGGPTRPRQHLNILSRRRQGAGGYGRGHSDGSC